MTTAIIKHASNGLKHRSVRDYLKMRFGKAVPAAGRLAKRAGQRVANAAGDIHTHVIGGAIGTAAASHRKGDSKGKTAMNALSGALGGWSANSAIRKTRFLISTRPSALKAQYKEILHQVGKARKAKPVKAKLKNVKQAMRSVGGQRIGAAITAPIDALLAKSFTYGHAKRRHAQGEYDDKRKAAKAAKREAKRNASVKASQHDLLFAKLDLILGHDDLELAKPAMSPKAYGTMIGRKAMAKRTANLGTQATLTAKVKSPMLRQAHKSLSRKSTAMAGRVGAMAGRVGAFTKPLLQRAGQAITKVGGKGKAGLAAAGVVGAGLLAHKAAKRFYQGPSVRASQDELQLGLPFSRNRKRRKMAIQAIRDHQQSMAVHSVAKQLEGQVHPRYGNMTDMDIVKGGGAVHSARPVKPRISKPKPMALSLDFLNTCLIEDATSRK